MRIPALFLVWLAGGWLLGSGSASAQAPPLRLSTPAGEVTVIADRLEEIGPDALVIATGNVELTRGAARLLADRVELNRETGDAVATGRVIFYDGDDRLTGDRIDYNVRTGTGVVYEGDARVAPYYRLSGARLDRLGESVYRVERGVFTTCEADPPAWAVKFGSAVADLEDWLWGRDASFWVRGIPLIPWFPLFAAPIRRERQTGFLIPKAGQSSTKGFFVEVPFYWAISDSQDLTVGLQAYSQRGIGGSVDYRYILSQDHRGWFRGFLLQETQQQDRTRGWFGLYHDWLLAPGLSLKADAKDLTDNEVFRDYADTLHQRSAQYVESNVFLTRTWPTWSFVANAFWYRDLTTTRPVELHRLPDLALRSTAQPVPGVPGLLWQVESGAVRFVRELGSDGTRLDLRPHLMRPISLGGLATLTPFVAGRLTGYDRRVTGLTTRDGIVIEETEDELRLRRLVEAGIDLETIASRIYPLGGWHGLDAVLHSIEPRVNYTWIDGANLDELPAWSAVDTVQRTNRLAYLITNRIRAKTVAAPGAEPVRWEMMRLTIGHFVDLREGQRRTGEIFADLILRPTPALYFRGDVQVDPRPGAGVQSFTTDVAVTLPRVASSIGTRYDKPGRIHFLQGVVQGTIFHNVGGRIVTNWDLRTNTFVEQRVGLDIRFQCWAFSVEAITRHRGEDELRFAVNLLGMGAPLTTSFGLGGLAPGGLTR